MDAARRLLSLRAAVEGRGAFSIEALVHISRRACASDDRSAMNSAFEALCKRAAPLLLSQARRLGLARDERRDLTQDVFLRVFEAIRDDKADFAESNFAVFALRAAISLRRKRKWRLPAANHEMKSAEKADPLESLPSPAPSPEELALFNHDLEKLPPKQREAFIQYYLLGMTRRETAEHHGVTVRTVYNWLKAAVAAMGLSGGSDDR